MIPGRMPDIRSWTMLVSVIMPKKQNVIDGGIMIPNVPPAATVPTAKAGEKPRLVIS